MSDPPEHELLFYYASAIGYVVRHLHVDLKRLLDRPPPAPRFPEHGHELIGRGLALKMLQAFATELALKALSAQRCGIYRRTHDLRILFDRLDAEAQGMVISLAEEDDATPVEEVLEDHRNNFARGRYPGAGGGVVAVVEMQRVFDALMLTYTASALAGDNTLPTYNQIQAYVRERQGWQPKSCWIAHCKEMLGLPVRRAPNRPGDKRMVPCPREKRTAICNAMLVLARRSRPETGGRSGNG